MSDNEVYRERESTLRAQLEKTLKMLEALPPYDPAREMLSELVQRLTEAVANLPKLKE